jgi:glycerol-3-phosphate acyltransferase PlsX
MSGDLGPRVVIAAAFQTLAALLDNVQVELILVGDQLLLEPIVSSFSNPSAPLRIHHAPDQVSMDEDPLDALRHKKQSSMWLAIALVRDGLADACVSAGNTGALMAIGRHLLKTFPGIDRPAICKSMPVLDGRTYMLDLGANPVCTSAQLAQFALMGSVLTAATYAANPRVVLLNIGVEETKGTETIKAAQELLRADTRINYAGYLEADQIYSGSAQVIVCDGFSGNVALKASEGVARLMGQKIEASFLNHWSRKFVGFLLKPMLRQWRKELNPGQYNGAIFLGLRKTLVKSHGSADQQAFAQALSVAIEQVLQRVPEKIQQQFNQ